MRHLQPSFLLLSPQHKLTLAFYLLPTWEILRNKKSLEEECWGNKTTMLGMATLTLGSSTTMVAQNHAQQHHATTLASSNGHRRYSVSNRTHSSPMSLVSPTNKSFTFLSSFKESAPARPFTTAVASVDSDQLNSSDPPTKVYSSLPLQPHIEFVLNFGFLDLFFFSFDVFPLLCYSGLFSTEGCYPCNQRNASWCSFSIGFEDNYFRRKYAMHCHLISQTIMYDQLLIFTTATLKM